MAIRVGAFENLNLKYLVYYFCKKYRYWPHTNLDLCGIGFFLLLFFPKKREGKSKIKLFPTKIKFVLAYCCNMGYNMFKNIQKRRERNIFYADNSKYESTKSYSKRRTW